MPSLLKTLGRHNFAQILAHMKPATAVLLRGHELRTPRIR